VDSGWSLIRRARHLFGARALWIGLLGGSYRVECRRTLFKSLLVGLHHWHRSKRTIFIYSTAFTTPQSSHTELIHTWPAVLSDTRARRGFSHVKAAAARCHHEAKPRRENGIGLRPAHDRGRDISAILQRSRSRRTSVSGLVSSVSCICQRDIVESKGHLLSLRYYSAV